MPAGGTIDNLARAVMAPALERELKAKVIIKNVSGAGGTTGTAEAATTRPDGYNFLVAPAGPVVIQFLLRNLPYSPDDFIPVYFISDNPFFLIVPTKSPYNTFQEFLDDAKANPGKIAYGTAGPGTVPHLTMAAMCAHYGLDMVHIPDRGGAEVMKSMATGTVQATADGGTYLTRFDNKGLVRFGDERVPEFPDIPSAKELDCPLRFSTWNAVWAPKGTPADIVEKVHQALTSIDNDPKAQEIIKNLGGISMKMSTKEFKEFQDTEVEKFRKIVKDAGLAPK
jgi:tripartite-type tricarboxylate transporter receptor subunit TctC